MSIKGSKVFLSFPIPKPDLIFNKNTLPSLSPLAKNYPSGEKQIPTAYPAH